MTELGPNTNHSTVTYGDKSKAEVQGLGKVVVARDITLVNVMLVESLGYNLMSVRALNKMNFDVYFTIDMVVLLRSKTLKVMYVGYIENELFVVDFSGSTNSQTMCLFGKADMGWLWHRRLSHVNMRTLQSLHKGGHIVGLKENVSFSRDRLCRACVEGKMHDSPHPIKAFISSKRILELLHVDLFGAVHEDSLGGKKYCLVIVDDYSRYTWVYFFKHKSETQQTVIDFTTEIQRQHNLPILAIRSDNGSEFKNYTLDEFLSEEGIRHQYSAAYTPQQNGVAERKNRTLIEMARSMLAEFKTPLNFWAEAISTACHSSNRLYFRKKLNKTPYELLTGNKPNVSYFRVFGCKCLYLRKGVRLSKFQSKALEGIFVGYGLKSHTYRIFDVLSRVIVETCSVEFDENNGSQVAQFHVCDADDEGPEVSIQKMGVGFFRPTELHQDTTQGETSSTQVEPSTSQASPAPPSATQDEPNREQDQDPHPADEDVANEPSNQEQCPNQDQDQPTSSSNEEIHVEDQGHQDSQDGDSNDQDDQEIPPRSNRDIEARRIARTQRNLEIKSHKLEAIIGDLNQRVTTRGQLASFSEHQAHISMVEPKKVFEALEDPDWLEAMHDELNNFKRNKVWQLVEIGRASCRERVLRLV